MVITINLNMCDWINFLWSVNILFVDLCHKESRNLVKAYSKMDHLHVFKRQFRSPFIYHPSPYWNFPTLIGYEKYTDKCMVKKASCNNIVTTVTMLWKHSSYDGHCDRSQADFVNGCCAVCCALRCVGCISGWGGWTFHCGSWSLGWGGCILCIHFWYLWNGWHWNWWINFRLISTNSSTAYNIICCYLLTLTDKQKQNETDLENHCGKVLEPSKIKWLIIV